MATSRFRAVFLFLILALVLTTAGCRSTTSRSTTHSSSSGRHLPWFPTSHEPDPTKSFTAELPRTTQDLAALNRKSEEMPMHFWEPPLDGVLRVTRPFQPPPAPYAAGHRGVDLAGSPDQPVLAAGSGTVTWAGVLAGRGVVVVGHGELRTTYEPVSADVVRGNPVRAGERLGRLQRSHPGCPVAACLHWGLLRGADYLDPMTLLNRDIWLLPMGAR